MQYYSSSAQLQINWVCQHAIHFSKTFRNKKYTDILKQKVSMLVSQELKYKWYHLILILTEPKVVMHVVI